MFDHNMVNGAEFEFPAVVWKGRIRIVRTLEIVNFFLNLSLLKQISSVNIYDINIVGETDIKQVAFPRGN